MSEECKCPRPSPEAIFLLVLRALMLTAMFVVVAESVLVCLAKYWLWLWRIIP